MAEIYHSPDPGPLPAFELMVEIMEQDKAGREGFAGRHE
jgi:hypothetical protein